MTEEINVRITTDGTVEGTMAVVVDGSVDGHGEVIPVQAKLTEDKEHMIVAGAIAIPLVEAAGAVATPSLKAIDGGSRRCEYAATS